MPQQMRSWPTVQSLSELHLCGQLAAQTPPQQMGDDAVPAQSESVVHAVGQAVACRQSDCAPAASEASSLPALAQQTSPAAVSHCELLVHVAGQSLAGVQMGVE